MKTRPALVPALAFSIALAACGGGGRATPEATPSGPPVSSLPAPVVRSAEEAGARVIASDRRFSGIARQDPDLIGQGSWWQAEARDGGYRVLVQIGWGDCPAGCINRHDWTFQVAPDGTQTLLDESGPPLPGE